MRMWQLLVVLANLSCRLRTAINLHTSMLHVQHHYSHLTYHYSHLTYEQLLVLLVHCKHLGSRLRAIRHSQRILNMRKLHLSCCCRRHRSAAAVTAAFACCCCNSGCCCCC